MHALTLKALKARLGKAELSPLQIKKMCFIITYLKKKAILNTLLGSDTADIIDQHCINLGYLKNFLNAL